MLFAAIRSPPTTAPYFGLGVHAPGGRRNSANEHCPTSTNYRTWHWVWLKNISGEGPRATLKATEKAIKLHISSNHWHLNTNLSLKRYWIDQITTFPYSDILEIMTETQSRDHIPHVPFWFKFVVIAKIVVAVAVLGLAAYGATFNDFFAGNGYAIFCVSLLCLCDLPL